MFKRDTATLRNRKGVALVTSMLVVTLAASVSAIMLYKQDLNIRKAMNRDLKAQADAVSCAAIDWARDILSRDEANSGRRIAEAGPEVVPSFPVENGALKLTIQDEQAKFNLNNLVRGGKENKTGYEQFKRLLSFLKLEGHLADTLTDWIDRGDNPITPDGAEDSYYLSLAVPYRAANRPLAHISELSLVKGFDESIIETLKPYVTALPVPSPVNINSAKALVIAAVIGDISPSEAEALVVSRKIERFSSAGDVWGRLGGKKLPLNDISLQSRYYIATAQARFDRAISVYEAMIELTGSGSAPRVVWRRRS